MFHVVRYFAKVSELSSPNPASFNYDKQGKDWQVEPGKQQSPIPLVQSEALRHEARQLVFFNYTKPLYKPYLTHNGHTVRMNISETVEKQNPALAGSNLKTVYLAQQLHFHWGSEKSQGSEHTIDSQRYDGELHIVHKNIAYESNQEAVLHPDGFVVLAVMLRCPEVPQMESPAMNEICKEVKLLRKCYDSSQVKAEISLVDLFAGIDMDTFFTYKGSLTTPPCYETVDWFVFPDSLDIPKEIWQNFWQLKDRSGKRLINTYRDLQAPNARPVYLCTGQEPKEIPKNRPSEL
ncbi:carbonic anhydrase 2 [Drosophila pseudoobscura]|uniref:Carbonic anhydrase n=1 Tax=Drosophila pseudoobscura pseudoobscura TaxID=46245 RepID=A0A6I8ULQ2_DROPS|nr:carbonic anhydrase 2 [Drosophila pseudoobscura]